MPEEQITQDHFGWSEDEEEAYERRMYQRDMEVHMFQLKKIDEEGGDISHLPESESSSVLQDPEQTAYP
jgi:hypothetical protein